MAILGKMEVQSEQEFIYLTCLHTNLKWHDQEIIIIQPGSPVQTHRDHWGRAESPESGAACLLLGRIQIHIRKLLDMSLRKLLVVYPIVITEPLSAQSQ